MTVPAAREGSWDDIFHRAGSRGKLLPLDGDGSAESREPRGHRAIGVVYDPAFERFGNYVPSVLPYRYDAFLSFDETMALHPLHIEPRTDGEPARDLPLGCVGRAQGRGRQAYNCDGRRPRPPCVHR